MIDTGATMTFLNSRMVKTDQVCPAKWSLRTATEEPANCQRRRLPPSISVIFKHRMLVAEVEVDVILGMHIRSQKGIVDTEW